MSKLQSYTVSAGITGVFNFEVAAPDPDTAITLAMEDWRAHGSANWSSCGPAETPRFQVEEVSDIPDADTKTYLVSFTVTDRLDARIQATSEDEARRIAKALRDNEGTYEGAFEIANSENSDMEIQEVVS
jgi:hypothetical protein